MATHFGISLICLASAALIARILFSNGRHKDPRFFTLEPPPYVRFLMVATFIASILVAYGGAYVRHSHSELACGVQWPLCKGSVVPDMGDNAGYNFGHRVSAIAITILIVAMVWVTYRYRATRPDYFQIACAALVVVILQSIAGGIVVLTKVQALSTLLHAALMAALFVILTDGVVRVLPSRRSSESAVRSPLSRRPAPAGHGD